MANPNYNRDPDKLFQPTKASLDKACVLNLEFGPMRG